jgi:hypothetical protein
VATAPSTLRVCLFRHERMQLPTVGSNHDFLIQSQAGCQLPQSGSC